MRATLAINGFNKRIYSLDERALQLIYDHYNETSEKRLERHSAGKVVKKSRLQNVLNYAYQISRKFPFHALQTPRPQITEVETLAIFLELLDSFQTFPRGTANKKQQKGIIEKMKLVKTHEF